MREADFNMRAGYTKDAKFPIDIPTLMSIIKQEWSSSSGGDHLCGSSHIDTLFSISEGFR